MPTDVQTYAEEYYDEFESLFFDQQRNRYLWGLSGRIGYENFEFLEENSTDKSDKSKTPWSISGHFGLFPASSLTLITVGLEYQNAFKNADERTICAAPDANGLQQCQTAPFGEPVDNDKFLLSLEGRRIFQNLPYKPAASLKLTYDFEDDTFGADLPIYLLRDAKSNLNGGVRFGWRDDTDDLIVGVFVGSTFSLF